LELWREYGFSAATPRMLVGAQQNVSDLRESPHGFVKNC
jgi:hypothetical protein